MRLQSDLDRLRLPLAAVQTHEGHETLHAIQNGLNSQLNDRSPRWMHLGFPKLQMNLTRGRSAFLVGHFWESKRERHRPVGMWKSPRLRFPRAVGDGGKFDVEPEFLTVSRATKKGAILAAKRSRSPRAFQMSLSLSSGMCFFSNGPQLSRGHAACWAWRSERSVKDSPSQWPHRAPPLTATARHDFSTGVHCPAFPQRSCSRRHGPLPPSIIPLLALARWGSLFADSYPQILLHSPNSCLAGIAG